MKRAAAIGFAVIATTLVLPSEAVAARASHRCAPYGLLVGGVSVTEYSRFAALDNGLCRDHAYPVIAAYLRAHGRERRVTYLRTSAGGVPFRCVTRPLGPPVVGVSCRASWLDAHREVGRITIYVRFLIGD